MPIAFKTVFNKEFAGFFRSGNAYIVLGIYALLSFAATFYADGYFSLDNTSLTSFFLYQPEILIVLLPAITMRSWTDERRQGTLEYLLTQPISYVSAVLAKFGAAWLFGLLMLSVSLPFWLLTSFLTPLDNLNILSSYLVCILIIGTFSALGCTVSAFNSNTVIAYIISIFVLWCLCNLNLDFLITPAENISDDVFVRVIRSLNFNKHYQDFVSGQIGLDNVIYFFSVMIPALWLNVIALEFKKK